jgi:hypothetical protein
LSDTVAGIERSINVCASASLILGPLVRSLAQLATSVASTSAASRVARPDCGVALIGGSNGSDAFNGRKGFDGGIFA